jgi:GTPase
MKKEEKVYHIYAKGECIYHSLSEEKFTETWEMLHRMVDLLGANISVKDLEYEQVYVNKLIPLNSSY